MSDIYKNNCPEFIKYKKGGCTTFVAQPRFNLSAMGVCYSSVLSAFSSAGAAGSTGAGAS